MNKNPIWIEIDCVGEETKTKYFGKFCLKPFLTIKEKGDVARLFAKYSFGLSMDTLPATLILLEAIAYFKIAVVESDCDWWQGDEPGMDLLDVEPVYALMNKYAEAKDTLVPKE